MRFGSVVCSVGGWPSYGLVLAALRTNPRRGLAGAGGGVGFVVGPPSSGLPRPTAFGVGDARSGLDWFSLAGCGRRELGLQAEKRLRRAPARKDEGSRCRVGVPAVVGDVRLGFSLRRAGVRKRSGPGSSPKP